MNETSVQKVLGLFDRTTWIITAHSENNAGGLVATFVNNASLVPRLPRLLIGIARHHHTWDLIQRSRSFAAHLVDEDQCELIWRFGLVSGRSVNKLSGVRWYRSATGSPVLQDALAWLDCTVEAELDVGDRTIFVASIVDGHVNRNGVALTSRRVFELASAAQHQQLQEERYRDEEIDRAAILAWREKAL
jgi:flavin reductase (DIM6/NTAB) family NADH-FMN oxidoreductase RutF